MVNVYQSMLTTLFLQQLLVQAGFRQQAEAACFHAGSIHVRLLDAPRLLIGSPSGTQYVAVLSPDHLRHLLATLGQPLATLPPQARLAAQVGRSYTLILPKYRLLPPDVQLYWTLQHGVYWARPWEETAVDLYHADNFGRGFFVEVGEVAEQVLVLRSFVSAGSLEDYAHGVQLPEL